jgi:hypothetical protein
MIHQVWRLSEPGDGNLGLACSDEGLLLGRTPLIERRNGRFAVRERSEIERLLQRAYGAELPLERLMAGLATVASALNASDPGLARIAAVHLRIPDLPSLTAREAMEATDILIKSADWNPALHPRTGTPPNPGWFAPGGGSDSGSPSIRIAQDDAHPDRPSQSSVGGDWRRPSLQDVQENPSLVVPVADRGTRQVDAVVAKLGLTPAQRRRLHEEITKQGLQTYHEVLEVAKDMFEK